MMICFFFQAEDGIRDLVRSRGLGDVYKRQILNKITDKCGINLTCMMPYLQVLGEIPTDDKVLSIYYNPVSYTHLRAHETVLDLVCRLLLEKKKKHNTNSDIQPMTLYQTVPSSATTT